MEQPLGVLTDELEYLIMDVALAHAHSGMDRAPSPDESFVDTGLTPERLSSLCMLRFGRSCGDDLSGEEAGRTTGRGAATPYVRAMLAFLIRVEEALGDLVLARNDRGEVTVRIAADVLRSYAAWRSSGADAKPPHRALRSRRPSRTREPMAGRQPLPVAPESADG